MRDWRKLIVQVALGRESAEIVIRNGRLVNVNTREVLEADVAIAAGHIAAIGDVSQCVGKTTRVVDAQGKYLVPGLIESHMHTESSGVSLTQLSRVLIPRGVTTIMYAHEMANILGKQGMDLVRRESQQVPLRVYFETPTSVPWAPGLETPAVDLEVDEVLEMLDWEESVSLGESDYFDLVRLNDDIFEKISYAKSLGKRVNGHIAEVEPCELMAAVAAGFDDDHESNTPEEVLAKLRLGMKVMLREANLPWLAPAVTENDLDTRNFLLCIDDKLINTLVHEGGVDQTVRLAIQHGIEPLLAIQFATINPAVHFHVDHLVGSITPGKLADVFITESLTELKPDVVITNGTIAQSDGQYKLDVQPFSYPMWAKNTVHLSPDLSLEDFTIDPGIENGEVEVRVIEVSAGGWVKTWGTAVFPVQDGSVCLDDFPDYNLMAVVERHGRHGKVGLGVVKGLKMQKGAAGSSVAHDCHNITVVGRSPEEMLTCVRALEEAQGGFAAVEDGEVRAQVSFEVGGLITESPYEDVVSQLDHFESVLRGDLGFADDIEIVVFNFLVLQSSPFKAAITDLGLIDVYPQEIVPLVINQFPNTEG